MTQEEPLVSVLIPAFNRVRFIADALQSVYSQSYGNIELIVVDDGSSDGTYEFLREHQEHNDFLLLTHGGHQNRGQSTSLNLGLKHAKGRYITILDSDDLFASGKFEAQVAFLESNPSVGMVYGQGQAIDENGQPLFRVLPDDHQEPGDPNRLLLDCYMALPGGAMVRKSVWDKAGYFEEGFRAAQDHDMALRLMEVAPVRYLPDLAFYYRKHDDAISKHGLERRWKTGFEILRRAKARYPYRRSTLRKRSAVLHFRLGQTYWRGGAKVQALSYLVRSGLLDPGRALRVLAGRERIS